MAILSIGFSCFDQFFFLNEWPRENTKTSATTLLKAAAVRRQMPHGRWIMGRGMSLHRSSKWIFTVSVSSMNLLRPESIPATSSFR